MQVHMVKTAAMLITSLFGFVINSFLFHMFLSIRGTISPFQKLCSVKALSNACICASILFWAVPLSAASVRIEDVWRPLNIAISQITASGGYILGPLLQVSMAGNRLWTLCFPFWREEKFPATNTAILLCTLISAYYTFAGMRGSCVLVYHPETLAWSPELETCSDSMDGWMLYVIVLLTAFSIFLNFVSAIKLIYDKVSGISESQKTRRRNKRLSMFTQNVIQDALHVIDMVNYTLIYKLSDSEMFQFVFMSLSFALIYTLDGLVMLRFHVYVQQKMIKKKLKISNVSAACVISPRSVH